jgi:hypothetical protein
MKFIGLEEPATLLICRCYLQGGVVMVVDQSAKAFKHLSQYHRHKWRCVSRIVRLESTVARSYTDDAEVRRGALSAPNNQYRPGQRDDVTRCIPASLVANL